MMTHSKEKNLLECQICGHFVMVPGRLELHIAMHGKMTLSCKDCGKLFHHERQLNSHYRFSCPLNNSIQDRTCPICGKVYYDSRTKLKHMKAIHSAPRYKCPQCPKKVYHKAELTAHVDSHLESRTFVCKICHKSYMHLQYLNRHMKAKHPSGK